VLLTAGGVLACLGFCALAVDYGTSVVVKNKLQRTCDAAALAGATELKRTGVDATDFANARARARAIATSNGVTISDSDVTFPDL
jgi:Flp pilus assembly protein TadG